VGKVPKTRAVAIYKIKRSENVIRNPDNNRTDFCIRTMAKGQHVPVFCGWGERGSKIDGRYFAVCRHNFDCYTTVCPFGVVGFVGGYIVADFYVVWGTGGVGVVYYIEALFGVGVDYAFQRHSCGAWTRQLYNKGCKCNSGEQRNGVLYLRGIFFQNQNQKFKLRNSGCIVMCVRGGRFGSLCVFDNINVKLLFF